MCGILEYFQKGRDKHQRDSFKLIYSEEKLSFPLFTVTDNRFRIIIIMKLAFKITFNQSFIIQR